MGSFGLAHHARNHRDGVTLLQVKVNGCWPRSSSLVSLDVYPPCPDRGELHAAFLFRVASPRPAFYAFFFFLFLSFFFFFSFLSFTENYDGLLTFSYEGSLAWSRSGLFSECQVLVFTEGMHKVMMTCSSSSLTRRRPTESEGAFL
ncbi:uncharacterized protein CIMG_13049 [Coccidioides immitis RS]|uniref:Transmembrane protein n=1 Tax=Coccidioides immitis (strain RS) TaxID=246410 RepID=A0A0D8JT70_COCIM|nr:uncharacterized protein CIMG_13049 [Coccidioides immitis RS]KJF60550.1 hypothetical protein CIMG_13049 [Coccidioides immitis RS]